MVRWNASEEHKTTPEAHYACQVIFAGSSVEEPAPLYMVIVQLNQDDLSYAHLHHV